VPRPGYGGGEREVDACGAELAGSRVDIRHRDSSSWPWTGPAVLVRATGRVIAVAVVVVAVTAAVQVQTRPMAVPGERRVRCRRPLGPCAPEEGGDLIVVRPRGIQRDSVRSAAACRLAQCGQRGIAPEYVRAGGRRATQAGRSAVPPTLVLNRGRLRIGRWLARIRRRRVSRWPGRLSWRRRVLGRSCVDRGHPYDSPPCAATSAKHFGQAYRDASCSRLGRRTGPRRSARIATADQSEQSSDPTS
jgi:hypothetical protein